MKLLAPVNSIKSLKLQIENGADEVYLGVETVWGKNISFAARGNYRNDGQCAIFTLKELQTAIEICKESNVDLCVTLNGNCNTGFLSENLHEDYNYIKFATELYEIGVRHIITSDIATLIALRKINNDLFITTSNIFESNNIETVKLLSDLGANRVVLPYQVTFDEIKTIRENCPDIEIEIFGHYGCSFHDGYCMLKHSVGEKGESGLDVGTPCRNNYTREDMPDVEPSKWLDSSLICSICSVPELINLGVDVIKVVGRELHEVNNCQLTAQYRIAIDSVKSGNHNQQVVKNKLPEWWKKSICPSQRCKYNNNTSIYKTFIGLPKNNCLISQTNNEISDFGLELSNIHINEVWAPGYTRWNNIPSQVKTIGIGYEFCSNLLRDVEILKKIISYYLNLGKRVVLITPCILATEFSEIANNIACILNNFSEIDIVLNDYGLIYYLSKIRIKKSSHGIWWAGRLINRSIIDWPWSGIILRDESSFVKELASIHSVMNNDVMHLLKEMSIDGIEMNNNTQLNQTIEFLTSNNMKTKVHLSHKLLSVSRGCLNIKTNLLHDKQEKINTCRVVTLNVESLESNKNTNQHLFKNYYPLLDVKGAGIYTTTFTSLQKHNDVNSYVHMVL